jgi:hypothetical protein
MPLAYSAQKRVHSARRAAGWLWAAIGLLYMGAACGAVSFEECAALGSTGKWPWGSAICEPPCWQGIVPGETTLQHALAILDNSSMVDPSTVYEGQRFGGVWPGRTHINWNERGWQAADDILLSQGYPNTLLSKDGLVESLLLRFDTTDRCTPTVLDVIERYGAPEKILRAEGAGYTPDIVWGEMDLLYPSRGLVFAALTGHPVLARPTDRIQVAYYFVPTSLDALAAEPMRFDFQAWYTDVRAGEVDYVWADRLEEWPGFNH